MGFFGIGGNKGVEPSPSNGEGREPFVSLESFGVENFSPDDINIINECRNTLIETGVRSNGLADTSAIVQQQTQEISQDNSQDLNNTGTKTGGIERL